MLMIHKKNNFEVFEPCSSVHLDIFENENLVTEQVYNLSFSEHNNSQSVLPVLSEYEDNDEPGRRKKTSLKKISLESQMKKVPNRIVKCMFKTSNDICNLEFAHNGNTNGIMIRHLEINMV
ncbi:hypothetical protein BpHYR1_041398 [Brachionus plicatilis]|uniref:Uncharacterized protein n=1 Tax=Brachionus plicatilis TaxID=10195 RepID=A0A3M7QMC7_BRAPC|nr:hypothetical protein BpHYR1_041398 [Brachionus plicatilis]